MAHVIEKYILPNYYRLHTILLLIITALELIILYGLLDLLNILNSDLVIDLSLIGFGITFAYIVLGIIALIPASNFSAWEKRYSILLVLFLTIIGYIIVMYNDVKNLITNPIVLGVSQFILSAINPLIVWIIINKLVMQYTAQKERNFTHKLLGLLLFFLPVVIGLGTLILSPFTWPLSLIFGAFQSNDIFIPITAAIILIGILGCAFLGTEFILLNPAIKEEFNIYFYFGTFSGLYGLYFVSMMLMGLENYLINNKFLSLAFLFWLGFSIVIGLIWITQPPKQEAKALIQKQGAKFIFAAGLIANVTVFAITSNLGRTENLPYLYDISVLISAAIALFLLLNTIPEKLKNYNLIPTTTPAILGVFNRATLKQKKEKDKEDKEDKEKKKKKDTAKEDESESGFDDVGIDYGFHEDEEPIDDEFYEMLQDEEELR